MRQTVTTALFALAVTVLSMGSHASDGLVARETTSVTEPPRHAKAGFIRNVKVNRALLQREQFKIELFDRSYTVVRKRIKRFRNGSLVWMGRLKGIRGSQVVITRHKGKISGFITNGRRTIELASNRRGQLQLYLVDEKALPTSEPSQPPRRPWKKSGLQRAPKADGVKVQGNVHQGLLIVYTQAACLQRGSCDALEADILTAVEDTNQAYVNSGVAIELNLQDLRHVEYEEQGILNSLHHLTWKGGQEGDINGELDEVHAIRNEVAADLVVLVTDDPDYCGYAWVNASAETAFSVVNWSCLSSRSLAHEVGHNQGSAHDREYVDVRGAFDYSHGYKACDGQSGFRTIMSYSGSCSVSRINHFSNPEIEIDGVPTGIAHAIDPDHSADNARSLNITAAAVSNFRQDPNAPVLLSGVGDRQDKIRDQVHFQIKGYSQDGEALAYQAAGLPNGVTLDNQTGVVSGTVADDAVDYYTVNVFASNGIYTAAKQFNWRVTRLDGSGGEPPLSADAGCGAGSVGFIYYSGFAIGYQRSNCETQPAAPYIVDPGPQTNLAGQTVAFEIEAFDPNGDTVTYTASGLPHGLSINPNTGVVSGNLTGASTGNHSVTITVSDGALSSNLVITWNVNSNIGVTLNASPTAIFEGQTTRLSWSVTNATSCTASGGAPGWAGTSIAMPNGSKNIYVGNDANYSDASFSFKLSCRDAKGTSKSRNASIYVEDKDVAISSFNASVVELDVSGSTTLSWSVLNGDNCTASGGTASWTGSVSPDSGSRAINLSAPGIYSFTLSCSTNGGGYASKSVETRVFDPIRFQYDARGRLIELQNADQDVTTYTLDDAGNRVDIERE